MRLIAQAFRRVAGGGLFSPRGARMLRQPGGDAVVEGRSGAASRASGAISVIPRALTRTAWVFRPAGPSGREVLLGSGQFADPGGAVAAARRFRQIGRAHV